MTSKVERVHDQLNEMGVRFVLDDTNDGWFFHHIMKSNKDPIPCDGMLYPHHLDAIYAAADYYGITELER